LGYDVVLLGQAQPTPIDLDSIEERLSRPEYALMVQSLHDIGFSSAIELFATFGGAGEDLKPWLQDALINRDRNLRLQYLAGLNSERYQQDIIYREMLEFRRFPEDLFAGSPRRLLALKAAIAGDN
jgi:spermidine synthase